jgi:hypothetical protein
MSPRLVKIIRQFLVSAGQRQVDPSTDPPHPFIKLIVRLGYCLHPQFFLVSNFRVTHDRLTFCVDLRAVTYKENSVMHLLLY